MSDEPNLPRLNDASLNQIPSWVTRPGYNRAALQPGIVHLGIGAFHRAHQAVYTDSVLAAGEYGWGIIGASLRGTSVQSALRPQQGLYTIASREANKVSLRIVGSVLDVLCAAKEREQIIAAMADPHVRIVSLTVTEKGYYRDPGSGLLLTQHDDIQHDIQNPQQPRTSLGFVLAALARRRSAIVPPFTVLSCDNLPQNGHTVHALLYELASAMNPDWGRWIEAELACPNTMVDRMVPATSEADRHDISQQLGLWDAWPVVAEPFSQWVIEDHFPMGRPRWEETGVIISNTVERYETMKLRLLNGSHSALAYMGALLGYATVAEAITDPALGTFIRGLMQEIAPTLRVPPDIDIIDYQHQLMGRFANSVLGHRLLQIATDGSQKLPQRLLDTIRDRLKANLPIPHLATVIAIWLRFLQGKDERGRNLPLDDPLASKLRAAASAREPCRELLGLQQVFGTDLSRNPQFRDEMCQRFELLQQCGVRKTLVPVG